MWQFADHHPIVFMVLAFFLFLTVASLGHNFSEAMKWRDDE